MSQVKLSARQQLDSITDFDVWAAYLDSLSKMSKASVHDLATSIIDSKDKVFSQDYIDFFNDTLLSEIEFEELDSDPFYIKNTRTQTRLAFSNRYTSSELRGARFRQFLLDTRNINPSLKLNDLLLYALKEPTIADLHKYLISGSIMTGIAEKNKAILIRSSRIALARLSEGKSLTADDLKAIVDEQHQLFLECPESLKPMHTQLMSTVETLENLLKEATTKRDLAIKGDKELDKVIDQLRSAIVAACDLLPDFNSDENKITYPANYQIRLNSYTEAASQLANNPSLKQFSLSSYLGISLFALGLVAITTCVAAVVFPPAALFMSQALLHGIVSVTAIEGTLAGAGVVAAGAGIGFFKSGQKFLGQNAMESLKSSSEAVKDNITHSSHAA